MKMRFERRCPRCRKTMTVGTFATRAYGGYWHPQCVIDYRKERDARTKKD